MEDIVESGELDEFLGSVAAFISNAGGPQFYISSVAYSQEFILALGSVSFVLSGGTMATPPSSISPSTVSFGESSASASPANAAIVDASRSPEPAAATHVMPRFTTYEASQLAAAVRRTAWRDTVISIMMGPSLREFVPEEFILLSDDAKRAFITTHGNAILNRRRVLRNNARNSTRGTIRELISNVEVLRSELDRRVPRPVVAGEPPCGIAAALRPLAPVTAAAPVAAAAAVVPVAAAASVAAAAPVAAAPTAAANKAARKATKAARIKRFAKVLFGN